ncbi:MAG TPA: hypothetical protein VNU92_18190 [Edaphobacter sp.]|jgi:hypothetical protein|nr:hypothetical protein [Edaphobacter sp.]
MTTAMAPRMVLVTESLYRREANFSIRVVGSVPESTIILAIQKTPAKFDVSAEGILALHAADITEPALNQMFRAATPQKQSGPSFGVATGTFPVKDAAGKMVHFSAWIKTENVRNGYVGLWWRVDGPGEGTNRPSSLLTTPWCGSSMASRHWQWHSSRRNWYHAMDPLRVRATRRQDRFQHQFRRARHRHRNCLGRLDEGRT